MSANRSKFRRALTFTAIVVAIGASYVGVRQAALSRNAPAAAQSQAGSKSQATDRSLALRGSTNGATPSLKHFAGAPAATGALSSGALWNAGKELSGPERPILVRRYGVRSQMEEFKRTLIVTRSSTGALSALAAGDAVQLPYFDGRVITGRVKHVSRAKDGQRLLTGLLDEGGTFTLGEGPRGFGGRILPEGETHVGVFQSSKTTRAFLLEKSRQAVMCVSYPKRPLAADGMDEPPSDPEDTITIPQLHFSSRPAVTAVVYLDFDGETVPAGEWGDEIDASHSWLNDASVKEIWQRVAEDFRPFKINVTTDPAVYAAAPVGSRMRCIVTSTTMVAPDSGGVAYLGSWADAGAPGYSDDVPCWVFPANLLYDPKAIADAISHEIGHTLGLSHDGLKDAAGETVEEYYLGHGSGPTGWAPIMGAGYYEQLTQWSRGEYAADVTKPGDVVIAAVANNTEDDLAIIASSGNRTGYIEDLVSGALAEAAGLPLVGAGLVDITGELSQTGDVDAFQFTMGAGNVHFSIGVSADDEAIEGLGNIDAQLELYDFSGNLLGAFNPVSAITSEFSMDVPAGVYRLRVRGTGEGDVAGNGYSNYGSVGRYRLTGMFSNPEPQAPVIGGRMEWSLVKGTAGAYQVDALGDPVAFYASGLPSFLRINASTGVISGTPTAVGEYAVMITVVNQQGSASRELNVVVLSGDPGDAVGTADLLWTQGGNRPWVLDTAVFVDRRSAIRSGAVQGDEQSWVETTVTGPGELSFRWRVSSEENTWQPGDPWDPETMPDPTIPYDRLEFSINGTREEFISGDVDWTQRVYAVPAGTHTLRWTYQKDPYTSLGEDAGWLDNVVYSRAAAPEITTPVATVVGEGAGYSFQIIASNAATNYSATGLPAGLVLDETTGIISGAPEIAGHYMVLLGATNAHGSATENLSITVQSRFVAWADTFGLADSPSLTRDDADNDGWSNLLEYAFASNPVVADGQVGPNVALFEQGGFSQLEVEFVRPLDRAELIYAVEVSDDLMNWVRGHAYGPMADNTGVSPTEQISRVTQADGGERIRVRDVVSGEAARFMRVRVAVP